VIAPFWGDHRFRQNSEKFNGYAPSQISYHRDLTNGVFTVQWKDLNINDQTVKSSIGDFQLKLYRSADPLTAQGDIEFCYGQIGGNVNDPGTLVVTKGASVGIKGEFADFLNGLEHEDIDGNFDEVNARTSQKLTNEWTPSGGNEKRIRFTSELRYNIGQWWGDGDADMSKGIGQKHYSMDQNRFVTVNDARVIMHSMVTKIPLDSVRRRNAYHGDVNHNGRYWYPSTTSREDIYWRDLYEGDNLPAQVPSIKAVFYQVTEYDAAMILHYISARLPYLPWLLDTIPLYGKVTLDDAKASAIRFGEGKYADNAVTIPIYLNGLMNGAVGTTFDLNSSIVDVKTVSDKLLAQFNGSTVVIAGTGEFDSQSPIAFVTVNAKDVIEASNIRFNDRKVADIKMLVAGVDDNDNSMQLMSSPNPFTATTLITVNVPQDGAYTLNVYDIMGNKVKTIAGGEFNAGIVNYTWDGTNDANEKVQSGAYIYRFIGENVSLSKKLIYNR
jgi:hypothetical protein